MSIFIVQTVVCGMAVLPVVVAWMQLDAWLPARVAVRTTVFSLLVIPSYVAFALGLMVLSAVATRVTGVRTPLDREMRIAEMDWTLMSLWTLTLISLAQGVPGKSLSIAGTLRVVRGAMTRSRQGRHERLSVQLRRARRDTCTRRSSKSKRRWPKKGRLHRCGIPLARTADAEERARYQALNRNAA